MEYIIAHSAKGSTWKNHKYVTKIGNRYVYKDDEKRRRQKISAEYKGDENEMKAIEAEQKLADMNRPLSAELEKNGLQLWNNLINALGAAGTSIKNLVTPDSVAVNNAKNQILEAQLQAYNLNKMKTSQKNNAKTVKSKESNISSNTKVNAKSQIKKTAAAGSKLVNKKPKSLVSPSMQSYTQNEKKKKEDKKNRQTNLRMRLSAGKQKA